jgi:hypothetical protein
MHLSASRLAAPLSAECEQLEEEEQSGKAHLDSTDRGGGSRCCKCGSTTKSSDAAQSNDAGG